MQKYANKYAKEYREMIGKYIYTINTDYLDLDQEYCIYRIIKIYTLYNFVFTQPRLNFEFALLRFSRS